VNLSVEAVAETAHERDALLGVIAAVIRPLMPLAFECGLSARDLSDTARQVYVQALEARLGSQKRSLSDARLALLSGLTRSEVARFREAQRTLADQKQRAAMQLDQITSLLSIWHTHPRFSGAYGLSLDLDLNTTPGSSRREFSELVETACPGADVDAILDELIAVGAVEIVEGTTIRCRSRAYVWSGNDRVVKQIDRAARFLEAAATSFASNLRGDGPGSFERTVVSDLPLPEDVRAEFVKMTKEKGEAFITELDTFLSKSVNPDATPTQGKRCGVSVFFFDEEADKHGIDKGERPQNGQSAQSGRPKSAYPQEREIDVLAPPPGIAENRGASKSNGEEKK